MPNGLTPMLRYARYLFRHKWFVFTSCARAGIPWRGIVHDLSKFLPDEFLPYARYFGSMRDAAATPEERARVPESVRKGSREAWERHKRRNRHHWQWWVEDTSHGPSPREMPPDFVIEMVCDWIGTGKAQGRPDTVGWYLEHREEMLLAPETRLGVEILLGLR